VVIYRIVRAVSRAYFYVAFAGYLLAFAAAFGLMIIPIVTIAILLGSLYSLVFVVGLGRLIGAWERSLAKGLLERGICPRCRESISIVPPSDGAVCVWCGASYGSGGEEIEREVHNAPSGDLSTPAGMTQ
jgi:hypothetical protein